MSLTRFKAGSLKDKLEAKAVAIPKKTAKVKKVGGKKKGKK